MAQGKKTGGRTSGTPNKVTKDIRETIKSFLENNIDSLQESFNQLEPYQKVHTITKLLDFTIPKLKQIEGSFGLNDLELEKLRVNSLFPDLEETKPQIEVRDVSGLTREEVAEWQRLDKLTRVNLSEKKAKQNVNNQNFVELKGIVVNEKV